jgi:hypothetical protein
MTDEDIRAALEEIAVWISADPERMALYFRLNLEWLEALRAGKDAPNPLIGLVERLEKRA